MSQMVEYVARQLRVAGLREDYDVRLAMARAAISAMREPSKKMIEAMKLSQLETDEDCEAMWNQVIDEALK